MDTGPEDDNDTWLHTQAASKGILCHVSTKDYQARPTQALCRMLHDCAAAFIKLAICQHTGLLDMQVCLQAEQQLRAAQQAARADIDNILDRQQVVHTSNRAYFEMLGALDAAIAELKRPQQPGNAALTNSDPATAIASILQHLASQNRILDIPDPSQFNGIKSTDQDVADAAKEAKKVSQPYMQ